MPVRCQMSISSEAKQGLSSTPPIAFPIDSKVLNCLPQPKVRTPSVIGPERAFTRMSEAARRDQ
jgi:hypothetical protein